ncbi:hypothetical protein [Chryseobacterium sp. ERMR1:04]|nr:hypothetical protein [Chryseobacterium sp. ERMR1:04]
MTTAHTAEYPAILFTLLFGITMYQLMTDRFRINVDLTFRVSKRWFGKKT